MRCQSACTLSQHPAPTTPCAFSARTSMQLRTKFESFLASTASTRPALMNGSSPTTAARSAKLLWLLMKMRQKQNHRHLVSSTEGLDCILPRRSLRSQIWEECRTLRTSPKGRRGNLRYTCRANKGAIMELNFPNADHISWVRSCALIHGSSLRTPQSKARSGICFHSS